MTTRRRFLKACAAAGVFMPGLGIGRLAFAAQAPVAPLTVVVFLRGGCDGLLLVGPSNEPAYIEARPSDLRVLDAGERAGLPLANGLASDLDFRLHPDARPLHELYQAGQLAVVHAAGLTNGTRSHFEAQDLIERGVSTLEQSYRTPDGWLTRYLALEGRSLPGRLSDRIEVLAAGTGLPASLARRADVLALPDLQGGVGLPGGADGANLLGQLYAMGDSPVELAGRQALAALSLVDARLPRTPDGKIESYAPAGAGYESGGFSLGLQAIARVAQMQLGLRVACIDLGSWDTHEGEAGRFAALVTQLSRGLAAFHRDLTGAGIPFRLVAVSEFGRRLRANRSQGTDHGHGGVMLVLGDGVRGGHMLGRWPGLSTPALDQGVDLAVTTDGRAVLAEMLGLDGPGRSLVFPGLAASAPFGVLA